MILAPANVLLNWEEEFKKWKMMDIPFHHLNVELSEMEKEFVDFYLRKARKRSLSLNETRLVKLVLWKKEPSILAVSYNLFEKVTGGSFDEDEGKKKKKEVNGRKKRVLDKESKKHRMILLEQPGLLVLDDGHTPRNHRSGIWKALSKVQTQKRIILSGTLFQNNFIELYNTFCAVRPSFPKEIPPQLKKFCQKKLAQIRRDGEDYAEGGKEREELKELVKPFVNVHEDDILHQKLPGLRECCLLLYPSDLQKMFSKIIEPYHLYTFEYEHKMAISVHPLLLLEHHSLSKTEKSAIHQVISVKHGTNVEDFKEELRQNTEEGAKMHFLIEFIRLADSLGERVLVFSQYIDPLEFAMEQLKKCLNWTEGEQILYMYGKLALRQRDTLIKAFNDFKIEAKVMLASTRACSEGIHLVGASRVIFLDVVWNPAVEQQDICRAFRLGQKRGVFIYHLMSDPSEIKKYSLQTEKVRMSKLMFSSSKETKKSFDAALVDVILDEMIQHVKLKDLFAQVVYQPKDILSSGKTLFEG